MEPVTPEELALFHELKDDLVAAVKQHGAALFTEKTCPPFAGLVNQGATCYLVSVVVVYCIPSMCQRRHLRVRALSSCILGIASMDLLRGLRADYPSVIHAYVYSFLTLPFPPVDCTPHCTPQPPFRRTPWFNHSLHWSHSVWQSCPGAMTLLLMEQRRIASLCSFNVSLVVCPCPRGVLLAPRN